MTCNFITDEVSEIDTDSQRAANQTGDSRNYLNKGEREMTTLMDFQEPGPENDRVVQMALREIDTALLARAMDSWSDD